MNIWGLVKKVPKGKVTTYSELGKKLKIHPRAVGKLLNSNTNLVKIPCHRVVMSGGKVGGYKSGIKKKISLLKQEGIEIKNNKITGFKACLFRF